MMINADGTGRRTLTSYGRTNAFNPKWTPDGQTIIFEQFRESGRRSAILAMPVAGGSSRVIYDSPRWDTNPTRRRTARGSCSRATSTCPPASASTRASSSTRWPPTARTSCDSRTTAAWTSSPTGSGCHDVVAHYDSLTMRRRTSGGPSAASAVAPNRNERPRAVADDMAPDLQLRRLAERDDLPHLLEARWKRQSAECLSRRRRAAIRHNRPKRPRPTSHARGRWFEPAAPTPTLARGRRRAVLHLVCKEHAIEEDGDAGVVELHEHDRERRVRQRHLADAGVAQSRKGLRHLRMRR